MQMDEIIYLIYVFFSMREITLGSTVFAGGCALIVVSLLAAFFMAVTSRSSKKKMQKKMQERY